MIISQNNTFALNNTLALNNILKLILITDTLVKI